MLDQSESTPAAQSSAQDSSAQDLVIGTHSLPSRLILGTGLFDSFETMQQAIEVSETDCVTIAVRREKLNDSQTRNILDFIDLSRITLLPNTAGSYDATTAVRYARMGRAILESLENPGFNWVKLEVLGDSQTLLPDPFELLKATQQLVSEGFEVLCYTNDDPVVARRLKDAGAAAVMPAGSPIGSGLGVINRNNHRLIINDLKRNDPHYPVILDAGVGTASDASIAMEMGFDAVLLNSAVAHANQPAVMAKAMKHAIVAGKLAFEGGRMDKTPYGTASTPQIGVISKRN